VRWVRRLILWPLAAFCVLVATIVAALFALSLLPTIGTPSAEALNASVADEADGIVGFDDQCRRVDGRRLWRCTVSDTSQSAAVDYRVRMRGRRCWEATLLSDPRWDQPTPAPRNPSGCAHLDDQLRLFD
jgi:hypothetical protein